MIMLMSSASVDPTKPEYYRVTVHDDSTKDPDFKLISEGVLVRDAPISLYITL